MALAGGVSRRVPQAAGYLYQEGGILSPDGHCRAFDAERAGHGLRQRRRASWCSSGWRDALADGDTIHAVIKGSAINNDGSLKVGFTAPERRGAGGGDRRGPGRGRRRPRHDRLRRGARHRHAAGRSDRDRGAHPGVPRSAHRPDRLLRARLGQDQHRPPGRRGRRRRADQDGAGARAPARSRPACTSSARTRRSTSRRARSASTRSCADWRGRTARRGAPASARSASAAPTRTSSSRRRRRAAARPGPSRPWQLLLLSARTPGALEAATDRPRARTSPSSAGRPTWRTSPTPSRSAGGAFAHRRSLVCRDAREAARRPRARATAAASSPACTSAARRPVAFLFPGQGAQHPGMGARALRRRAGLPRRARRCAELLRPQLGRRPARACSPRTAGERGGRATSCERTELAQPALFAVEYALARLWMSWGVAPRACSATASASTWPPAWPASSRWRTRSAGGARGRLMAGAPRRARCSPSPCPRPSCAPLPGERGLSLAAVNGPDAVRRLRAPEARSRRCAAQLAERRRRVPPPPHLPRLPLAR